MDISLPSVKTPTDVLAVVPYLLGFTPERSIVVIAMRDRRVVFQVRADLPATNEIAAVAGHLATVVARQRVDSALIVAYGADTEVRPTVEVLRESLEERRVTVLRRASCRRRAVLVLRMPAARLLPAVRHPVRRREHNAGRGGDVCRAEPGRVPR